MYGTRDPPPGPSSPYLRGKAWAGTEAQAGPWAQAGAWVDLKQDCVMRSSCISRYVTYDCRSVVPRTVSGLVLVLGDGEELCAFRCTNVSM